MTKSNTTPSAKNRILEEFEVELEASLIWRQNSEEIARIKKAALAAHKKSIRKLRQEIEKEGEIRCKECCNVIPWQHKKYDSKYCLICRVKTESQIRKEVLEEAVMEIEEYAGHIMNDGSGKPMHLPNEKVLKDILDLLQKLK